MTLPSLMHPALYRTYQFFVAVKASLAAGGRGNLSAADQTLVAAVLPAQSQQRLFAQMPPNDRRHAIAVTRMLQAAGYRRPALLQAALLHDAGKSMGQPILHRVLIVLFEAFWPELLARLAAFRSPETDVRSQEKRIREVIGWRRPFVIHAHHPLIGAAWAASAACEPLAVRLIARHEDRLDTEPGDAEDQLLTALQWADDLN